MTALISRPMALAIAAALVHLPATAQNATPAADTLDRVTVSASTSRMPESDAAMPNTITVISQEELRQQLAVTQDVSQVLGNLVPSFSPSRQKLTNGGETLRGRKPLYLVDGMPQSTPLREGGRDGHTIDPAMIERIEVIHGANALQGLGASGGIINIITKRAPRKVGESYSDVALGVSSALPSHSDSSGYRASYLFGSRQQSFDLVAGISYAAEGLYYDGHGDAIAVNDVQGDLMDAKSLGLFLKAGWQIDDSRRLQASIHDYRLRGNNGYRAVNGDISTGQLAKSIRGNRGGEAPQNHALSVSLDYSDSDLWGGYLQAQVFAVNFAGRYGLTSVNNFWNDGRRWQDQSENISHKRGAKFSWSRSLLEGRARVLLGLDLSQDTTRQAWIRSGLNWVPQSRYRALAPLLQGEFYLTDSLMLTGGLRHERGELEVDSYTTLPQYNGGQQVQGGTRKSRETLPNLGLVWEATPELKLYASYSEGYTVADIGRVLRAINKPGQSVTRLVDLTPVIADNRELGMDYENDRWRVHLAWYQSHAKLGSRLAFDRTMQVYNVVRERTEIEGVEANLSYRPSDASRVGLLMAQSNGRYDSNGDNRVDSDLPGVNISPDRISLFWEQQWNARVHTRLQANQMRDRRFNLMGVETARFDGYFTLDANARLDTSYGSWAVGIENLTNRQFVSYYSQTTPRNDTYTAGRGRVLTLNWSQRF